MMSAKMATPCLVKLTVFWDKGYEDIVPASDVTDKILSSDSNYIADVSLWPRFDKCSISMREVIITSILQGFDQKKRFFVELVLVQV